MQKNIIPLYPSTSKILVKSNGCYQYDSEGKKYLDLESGVWCANLGHSHPRITGIMEKQIKESLHQGYRFRNLASEKLSEELQRLCDFTNGASVFLSSGSEAVNLSITIAQKITQRRKILKIDNSYLSAYGFGQLNPDNEYLVNVPYNDISAIESIDFSTIAAFVLETGGASVDMVRFPDKTFVELLAQKAKSMGCLLIAEEVTTGFGRLGKWFGYQHYELQPDMVVSGKAMGNGYPVSAVTINGHVSELLNRNLFVYAQSHQNDPLGCVVALEVIRVMEEQQLIEKCKNTGQYFAEQLAGLKQEFQGIIKDTRGLGLMLALEFEASFNGHLLNEKLFESGFVFGFKKNTLRFLPPLVIEKADIDKLISTLRKLIQFILNN